MIALRWTCPKHKRYNPEREGQGGIRGNCSYCLTIFDEWRRWYDFMRAWREARDHGR